MELVGPPSAGAPGAASPPACIVCGYVQPVAPTRGPAPWAPPGPPPMVQPPRSNTWIVAVILLPVLGIVLLAGIAGFGVALARKGHRTPPRSRTPTTRPTTRPTHAPIAPAPGPSIRLHFAVRLP